jgi:uncharacterized protein YgiM (DUF1202 family)
MISIIASVLMTTAFAGSIAYGAGTVSATGLNVRSGAGTSNSIITTVSNGDIVVILEKTSDTWYKINFQGTEGYVDSQYLKDVLTAENFSAYGALNDTNVRMRSTPSLSGEILGLYSVGTTLPVIGINNGWYKVKDGDKVGYIRSDLIDIVSDCTTERAVVAVSSGTTSLGEEIAEYAQGVVGYRYVYGAESPSVGFDCSGLVYYVYGQFGYCLSRGASSQYRNNGTSISKSDLIPGDLVFFSSNGGVSVTHVGIYIGNNQFVHASTSSTGVIISSLTSAYYTRVWYGAKRIIS